MMQVEKIFGMWFVRGDQLPANIYSGEYDLALIVISYVMALFASYVGLATSPLITNTYASRRWFWILLGGVAMGGGIWSMHFIGMLAYQLPFEVGYDAALTLLSVLPAILGAAAALSLFGAKRFSWRRLLLSSVCLALGIGTMHFIGMAAMSMDAAMVHQFGLFVGSLVVAFALAFGALYLESRLRINNGVELTRFRLALAAAIIALAVSGMHYTAMESVYFFDGPAHRHDHGWIIQGDMLVVMLNMFVLLLIGLVFSSIMGMSSLADASLLRNVFFESSDGLMVVDRKGVISLFSPAAEQILGYQAKEVVGTSIEQFLPEAIRSEHRNFVEHYYDTERHNIMGKDREVEVLHKSGRSVPVEVNVNPLKTGNDFRYSLSIRDIRERKTAELELVKLHQTIEQSPITVIITDIGGCIEYVNPQFSKITGYSAEEVVGQNPRFLNTGYTNEKEYASMWANLNAGKVWRGEFRNRKKNGDLYWNSSTIAPIKDPDGNTIKFIGLQEDITLRKDYEERLFHEANFSPLTHQPNRSNILNNITLRIDQQDKFSLIFVDLMGLGQVNDSLGFQAGDELIIQAAKRMDTLLDQSHFLAHLGGDQFLFLVLGEGAQPAEILIQDLLALFQQPMTIHGETIYPAVKLGISMHPEDGDTGEDLLSKAHSAMNQISERNAYAFYSEEFNREAHQHLHMEALLRQALSRKELCLFYQPKVDVETGRCIGAEALLRWFSAELGFVSPAEFIPLAERSDLILPISKWVIQQSCRDARQLVDDGHVDFSMAINISPRQFAKGDLPSAIDRAIKQHRIQGRHIELEVTEGLFIDNSERVRNQFEQLKQLGVSLALDDFGTGYSSLAYLRNYSFDTLKIDQSFVRDLPMGGEVSELTSAIVRMGQALGMKIVAEGVETAEQADRLKSEGCDLYQGYFYGKPMPFDEFSQWLKNQSSDS